MSCNLHSLKPWLIALVLVLFIVPLKADLQVIACSSEYHDNDHLLIPAQEAMSDVYALETSTSEECVHPLGVRTESLCTIDHNQ